MFEKHRGFGNQKDGLRTNLFQKKEKKGWKKFFRLG